MRCCGPADSGRRRLRAGKRCALAPSAVKRSRACPPVWRLEANRFGGLHRDRVLVGFHKLAPSVRPTARGDFECNGEVSKVTVHYTENSNMFR
jgi:hypothetical protein